MVGRPREFDEAEALEQAMRLFWRKGYRGTSLEDLLKVMGISRSSFYAQYQCKEDLFVRSLHFYTQLVETELQAMLSRSTTARSFLVDLFESIVNDAETGERLGCLIVNSATEIGGRDSQLAEEVRQAYMMVVRLFQQVLENGREDGSIVSSESVSEQARYLTTGLSGLRAMVKGGMSPGDARGVARKILLSLAG